MGSLPDEKKQKSVGFLNPADLGNVPFGVPG